MNGTWHALNWLSPEVGARAEHIRSSACESFNLNPTPVDQCEHGREHCSAIENAFHHLIPGESFKELNEKERFYLLTSPWIMNIAWTRPQRVSDVEYHRIACQHLNDPRSRQLLRINGNEARIFENIIYFHRFNTRLEDCPPKLADGPEPIRVRLLTAYLRLADAIHVDDTRGPKSLFYFLQDPGSPELFHWLKSKLHLLIQPEPETDAIQVYVMGSIPTTETLIQRVKEELELYVDAVRNTLVQGGVTKYLHVNVISSDGAPLTEDVRNEVDRLLKEFALSFPPNAGLLQDLYISSIQRIIQQNAPASAVINEIKQVQAIAEDSRQFRPCHVAFARLIKEVNDLLTPNDHDQNKVRALAHWAGHAQKDRSRRLAQVAEHGSRALQGFDNFLLFGFSNTIVETLKKTLGDNNAARQRAHVYVCEAHNKSSFDLNGRLMHVDGMNYARELKAALPDIPVTLIPDVTVADVISLNRDGRWAALFGTDGITPHGKCGHTSGHLSLAIIARHFLIPVYVICDSSKMGDLRPRPALERKEQWIKSVPHWRWGPIEEVELQNLRESVVEPDLISMIITEDGMFNPAQFRVNYSPDD
jgi:translation initiation factor 2B subunit (eIF-2B alpha/beta/delta family)